jgi:Mor family transcriptional regulator
MADSARTQYPEILKELAAAVAASLIEDGVAPATAHGCAEKSVERLRHLFGGQLCYIPMGLGYNIARRNTEIRRRLKAGESRDAIRRECGLSEMQLRRIEDDDTPSRR